MRRRCGSNRVALIRSSSRARAALDIFADEHLVEDVGEEMAWDLEVHAAEVLHALLANESTLGLYHYRTVENNENRSARGERSLPNGESLPAFAVVNATKARARALLAGCLIERHMDALKRLAASSALWLGETDETAQHLVLALSGLVCASTHSAGTLAAVHWVGYACAQITGLPMPQLCLERVAQELQRPLSVIACETDIVANVTHTLKTLSSYTMTPRNGFGSHARVTARTLSELNSQALPDHIKMSLAAAQLLGYVAMPPGSQAIFAKLYSASVPTVLLSAVERWQALSIVVRANGSCLHRYAAYEEEQKRPHREAALKAVLASQAAAIEAIEALSYDQRGLDELLAANGVEKYANLLSEAASWSEPRPVVVRQVLLTLRNFCVAGVKPADPRIGSLQLIAERAGNRHGLEALANGVLAHVPASERAAAVCLEGLVEAAMAEVEARKAAREQEEARQREAERRQEAQSREAERREIAWQSDADQDREIAWQRYADRQREADRKPCECSWIALTDQQRGEAIRLGFSQRSWLLDDWQLVQTGWAELSGERSADAKSLGFTAASWHGGKSSGKRINLAPLGLKRPLSHVSSSAGSSSSGTGADPCVCTVCGKRLKTPAGMTDHRKAVHKM